MPAPTPAPLSRMPRRRSPWLAAALTALALAGCGSSSLDSASHAAPPAPPATRPAQSAAPAPRAPQTQSLPRPAVATSSAAPVPAGGTALAALAALPVKGRAPRTGYQRELFGQAWSDVDRNGCDTRNDVLRRDLTAYVLKAGTRGCLVLRGTLHDPYTNTTIAFLRGQSTSSRVQIDHVVALSDAWQKGAQQLSYERRTAFANDPLNLLSVDGATNQRKGDGDAATWLPPQRAYRCAYVARQVAVKQRYRLWVTTAEREAIARVLRSCPGQALPVARPIPLGGGRVESAPAPAPTTSAPLALAAPPRQGGATDPRFDTCRAAKAAGYGPYASGQDPEYEWYQDRDHDGLVCE